MGQDKDFLAENTIYNIHYTYLHPPHLTSPHLTSTVCQACRSCGDSVASKLEDISHQLASLTNILVGDNEDDNSSHCSVLRALAAEQDECSSEEQFETYLEGPGHPSHYREKSVMRELRTPDPPVESDDGGGDGGPRTHHTPRKSNRDTYYARHHVLTSNQQFLQFIHKNPS